MPTTLGDMSSESVVTLLLYAIILCLGSVAAVAFHSWWITVLFCSAVIAWGLRLVAQIHYERSE